MRDSVRSSSNAPAIALRCAGRGSIQAPRPRCHRWNLSDPAGVQDNVPTVHVLWLVTVTAFSVFSSSCSKKTPYRRTGTEEKRHADEETSPNRQREEADWANTESPSSVFSRCHQLVETSRSTTAFTATSGTDMFKICFLFNELVWHTLAQYQTSVWIWVKRGSGWNLARGNGTPLREQWCGVGQSTRCEWISGCEAGTGEFGDLAL